jgi:hypothetical protein
MHGFYKRKFFLKGCLDAQLCQAGVTWRQQMIASRQGCLGNLIRRFYVGAQKKDRPDGRSFSVMLGLFLVTGLAAGRNAIFLVAVFTQLVGGVFEFRCFRAVMTAAAGAGFDAFMMAFGAIADTFLVGFVGEGDIAHFCRELDFFRTIVGRYQGGGAESDKADCDQNSKNAFHVDLLFE